MIVELKEKEFLTCRTLINENQGGNIEVQAIIEGNNPGRIFVDSQERPSTGLVWFGNLDGFCFIGDPINTSFNQDINIFIDQFISPEARKLGLDWFECSGHHPTWDKTLRNTFEQRPRYQTWQQHTYHLQIESYKAEKEPTIKEKYQLKKITKEFYKTAQLSNQDFLQSIILEYWSSTDAFFEKGLGYGIIHKNEMVSFCYSGFVAGNIHAIGIETSKDHRGEKLAQKVAHAFIQECFEREAIPYWDCMEVNTPSNAVAQKLGFKKGSGYTGYEFFFQKM
jgi:RimJ/RimL family protein N-acetyltransferase